MKNSPEQLNVLIAQFCKAPILGHVKTRMETELSKNECLSLHKRLVERVLHTVLDVQSHTSANITTELWVTETHGFFDNLIHTLAKPNTQLTLRLQGKGHLGEKLAKAVSSEEGIEQDKRSVSGLRNDQDLVVLVGSDCIELTVQTYLDVIDCFTSGQDAVVIPALDGGFVLLAVRNWNNSLFNDIEWGSSSVLSRLKSNLDRLAFDYEMFPPMRDLDTPEDLSFTKFI